MAITSPFGPGFSIPNAPQFTQSFETCRLTAYPDSKGVWTIGWGHTGAEVVQGLIWTQQQADDTFLVDYAERKQQLYKLVKVILRPGQELALVDFLYNEGYGNLESSHLLTAINTGDWRGAAKEFQRFDLSGGREVRGLLQRRLAEALVFVRDSVW